MHRHYITYNYIKLHAGLSFIKIFFVLGPHSRQPRVIITHQCGGQMLHSSTQNCAVTNYSVLLYQEYIRWLTADSLTRMIYRFSTSHSP